MHWPQMQDRCPSSRFVTTALLPDHRLAFTRYSQSRGCGVADVIPDKSSNAWGVIYDIGETDLEKLDYKEGYKPGREKNSYLRVEIEVFENGDLNKPMKVSTYVAVRQPNPPPPSKEYLDLILSGAKHWGLPEEYLRTLASQPVRKH